MVLRLLKRAPPLAAGTIVALAVLGGAFTIVMTDSDDHPVSLVEAVAALGVFALIGVVVVLLTLWLDDDREPYSER